MARGINSGGLLRFHFMSLCFAEAFPAFLPSITCLRMNFRVSWSGFCKPVNNMNGIVARTS